MELIIEGSTSELFQAQTHLWNHIFNFVNSMALKCAVQLGIPDIIHNHGKPMTLSELVTSLPNINFSKAEYLYRLMRLLVHSGFFSLKKVGENEDQEGYLLTQASCFLLKDNPMSMRPLLLLALDPVLLRPFESLSTWFQNENPSAFSVAHGKTFWDYIGQDPSLGHRFNESLVGDSMLVSEVVLSKCKEVLEGLKSLVDVAGSTGTMAKAIAEEFPNLKCTVFDLPHVVADLQDRENLNFVGGDMFEAVPPADAILLKWILHDWSDEDCVKVLQKCREAVTISKGKEGKVIIIDMVLEMKNQNWDKKSTETQLLWDMQMMVHLCLGRERNEKEWAKIFFDAGFTNYKIHPILGLRALIEAYP